MTPGFTKRLVVAAVAIVALGVSSTALAVGGVAGKYAATIRSPAELKGKWVLTLAGGGSYTVAVNGKLLARGRYTATPKTITFSRERGSGCVGNGTYGWLRSGKTVNFVRKRETASCAGRAAVLSHPFTQVR